MMDESNIREETETETETETTKPNFPPLQRKRLPETRRSITHRIEHTPNLDIYVTVGFYNDNTPGEVFIKIAKEGSTLAGLCDGLGVLMSLMLQHGIPWDRIALKLRYTNFEPCNIHGHSITHAIVTAVDVITWVYGAEIQTQTQTQTQGAITDYADDD